MTSAGAMRPIVALAVSMALAGCGGEPSRPTGTVRGEHVVSVVDGETITAADVTRVVSRDGVSPERALRSLEDVALLVAEARRRGLDRSKAARRAEERALAQLVLRELEARVGPDAVADELASLRASVSVNFDEEALAPLLGSTAFSSPE